MVSRLVHWSITSYFLRKTWFALRYFDFTYFFYISEGPSSRVGLFYQIFQSLDGDFKTVASTFYLNPYLFAGP